MEHKRRSPVSVEQAILTSLTPKRHKTDLPLSSSKERKEKVGERIAALQQLVSPYGKTDTASVLLEATGYINFLHQQIKVLSAPYLHCTSTTQFQELESCRLRNKGLCVVPITYTMLSMGVSSSSNGADMWAPIKTTSPKSYNTHFII